MIEEFRRLVAANRPSKGRQVALLLILLYLLAFFIYAAFFASPEELKFLGAKQIDKIAHLLGGVFIAGVYEWICGRKKLYWLVALFFALTVGWELIELFFFASIQYFYSVAPDLWRLDSVGDVLAAALGCYGYWVFAMPREMRRSCSFKV